MMREPQESDHVSMETASELGVPIFSLGCPDCGCEANGEQYFCTKCGTSLMSKRDTGNVRSAASCQTSEETGNQSSASFLASETPLPGSASLLRQEKENTKVRQYPRTDLTESLGDQDSLTAEWAALVRVDSNDLPSHILSLSEKVVAVVEESPASKLNSDVGVGALIRNRPMTRGDYYLVAASVVTGAVLTWILFWK